MLYVIWTHITKFVNLTIFLAKHNQSEPSSNIVLMWYQGRNQGAKEAEAPPPP